MGCDRTRPHVLKTKPIVKWYEMIMCKQRNPIRDSGVLHALNVRLHQDRAQTHLLEFRSNRQGMNADSSTLILVAQWLLVIR